MNIEKSVIERLESLTPEQQHKLLVFLNSLEDTDRTKAPRRSLRGLFADLGASISKEDIEEERREMWGNFPGDIS